MIPTQSRIGCQKQKGETVFNICNSHVIKIRRLDIVLIKNESKECAIINIAVPGGEGVGKETKRSNTNGTGTCVGN